jgi:hypothetical protein
MPHARSPQRWLVLLSLSLPLAGCDSIDCEELRTNICARACSCDFCQINFPNSGPSVFVSTNDCVLGLSENACTAETETEALETCEADIDAIKDPCPLDLPDSCIAPGAFQN